MYQKAGRLDDAIRCYRRAIVLNPRASEARAKLHLALSQQAFDADAEQHSTQTNEPPNLIQVTTDQNDNEPGPIGSS